MRTLTGKLENVTYFDTSRNGNGRYTAHINGVQVFTGVDSCLGSALTNYRDKNVKLEARIIRGKLVVEGRPEVLPEHPDAAFYRAEFDLILGDMDHIPTIQLRGKAGKTKWMNVTRAQLEAIRDVMLNPTLAAIQN
jgi:hypothetical protein